MSITAQKSSSLKDPSNITFESPRTRRLILSSYWACILLALPLWWYLTSIERLGLPVGRVVGMNKRELKMGDDRQDRGRIELNQQDVETNSRVVQYAPRYRLAFTLLNEDAAAGDGVHGWEIEDAIKHYLSPILDQLSVLHNFTIETQVQFHAPLAFNPTTIQIAGGHGDTLSYGLTQEDLTVFVNSAQWTLSSSVSNDPVLHFVLFVPSATQRPLHILNADGSPSDSTAFLLPQWGGIVLFNPPTRGTLRYLSSRDLEPILQSFARQFLGLIGLPHLPPNADSQGTPLTSWQLDTMLRKRIKENVDRARDTLNDIVKTVKQIEGMPVGKDVRGDVLGALDALDEVFASPNSTIAQALLHSSQALFLASRAYFNPTMLALLYFPAEHKAAVYTPLFASVGVPLVMAVLREWRVWRMGRQEMLKAKLE